MSKHFKLKEFKCPCCGAVQVNNILLVGLEALRQEIGNYPIQINSGYRCQTHNAKVGGSPKSQHLCGRAADIVALGVDLKTLWLASCSISEFTGLGLYPTANFVHVDVRQTPSRSWGRIGKKYVSAQEAFELT